MLAAQRRASATVARHRSRCPLAQPSADRRVRASREEVDRSGAGRIIAAVRRVNAALGSAVFFVAQPGVVAGLVPWLLTRWHSDHPRVPAVVAGGVLVTVGTAVLLDAILRFVVEGRGTPAPVAPTDRLVVGGLYRHVRNPMYVAVLATILGQALLLGRGVLFAYAAAFWILVASFVRLYEEPTLAHRHGAQYDEYRRAVRGWLPRLRPWSPERS